MATVGEREKGRAQERGLLLPESTVLMQYGADATG
jgi:hypothetical protein